MKLTIFFIIILTVIIFNNFLAGSLSGTPLPKPTGNYAVGTRFFYLIDKDRPDLISPDPHDYRAISLQVWYPAEPGPKDQLILLSDRKLIEGYIKESVFDPTILTEWAMKPTHSCLRSWPATVMSFLVLAMPIGVSFI